MFSTSLYNTYTTNLYNFTKQIRNFTKLDKLLQTLQTIQTLHTLHTLHNSRQLVKTQTLQKPYFTKRYQTWQSFATLNNNLQNLAKLNINLHNLTHLVLCKPIHNFTTLYKHTTLYKSLQNFTQPWQQLERLSKNKPYTTFTRPYTKLLLNTKSNSTRLYKTLQKLYETSQNCTTLYNNRSTRPLHNSWKQKARHN